MDFYKQKREAFKLIDDMVSEGRPVKNIYFKVATKFGFSNKIVDQRLKMLEEAKGNIFWKERKNFWAG